MGRPSEGRRGRALGPRCRDASAMPRAWSLVRTEMSVGTWAGMSTTHSRRRRRSSSSGSMSHQKCARFCLVVIVTRSSPGVLLCMTQK